MISGNTSETGDVGESPGKSSLFFLTTLLDLGIGLPWMTETVESSAAKNAAQKKTAAHSKYFSFTQNYFREQVGFKFFKQFLFLQAILLPEFWQVNIFSIMLSVNPISENSAEFQNSNFEIPSSIIWTRNFDLSCADLDVYDKFYACSKFQEMIEGPNKVSLRAFCGNHAVPVSTFRDWYRHYLVFRKTGEITMGRKCGRPPLIDEKVQYWLIGIQYSTLDFHSRWIAETPLHVQVFYF